jgi:DNA repair exonuclease SbcCD nuclease subunit
MITLLYRIALEADKHWGAMRPEDQYRSSYILKRFLAEYPLDLYINLGDFFDSKLLLNSKASLYAVRDFSEKIELCRSRGIPCRAIKGTRSHDYDQWEIFDKYMRDPQCNFRYFRSCSVEETLPGLRIWYGPEENVNFTQYVNQYADMLLDGTVHLAALHGNFDKIMPALAVQVADTDRDSTTLVYHYDELADMVHGPLIAGHWHDGETYEHLSYVGSYDRWSFGEDELKGFMIVEYDTETEQYRQIKVPNILAGHYKTYELYTSLYKTVKEYKALIEAVDASLKADTKCQVRILVKINEEQSDTDQQLENLKYRFANEKRVHFTVINQLKKETRSKEREKNRQVNNDLAYIRDPNVPVTETIQRFIEQMCGRHYELEDIERIIAPYLTNQ